MEALERQFLTQGNNATHALRDRLILAGDSLLESGTAANDLTPDLVARHCDTDTAMLLRWFPDWPGYLGKLTEHFVNEVMSDVIEETSALAPGVERLCRLSNSYLDANLRRPWLRQLFCLLYETESGAAIRRTQKSLWNALCGFEMNAAGVIRPELMARMAGAIMWEVLIAERSSGHALPASRDKMHRFLHHLTNNTAG